MSDNRIDGQIITTQSNLANKIAQKLDISATECKQMDSIWNQVVDELNSNDYTNNTTNNDRNIAQNATIIKLSRDSWQKIVNIINNTLHKNNQIPKENTKEANLKIGKELIERFNKEFPNAESSTYLACLANYLEANNGDKNKIKELRARADELDVIFEQQLANNVPAEECQVKQCGDRADILTKWLKEQGIENVQKINITSKKMNYEHGEHVFNVIGMAENADTKDPTTWGENAVIIDAWAGKTFTPQEGLEFYKDFFTYKSVDEIQTGTLDDMEELHQQVNKTH